MEFCLYLLCHIFEITYFNSLFINTFNSMQLVIHKNFCSRTITCVTSKAQVSGKAEANSKSKSKLSGVTLFCLSSSNVWAPFAFLILTRYPSLPWKSVQIELLSIANHLFSLFIKQFSTTLGSIKQATVKCTSLFKTYDKKQFEVDNYIKIRCKRYVYYMLNLLYTNLKPNR